MAVQETKLTGHSDEFDAFGLHYVGTPAHVQNGSLAGGTGFFVRDTIATHITYLGPRRSRNRRSPPKFAAEWAKLYGSNTDSDIYLASVYLPCTGSPKDE